ncbi:protein-export chaperone SecB [Thiohalorhabdus methylotrophus]|uniref:Protein-export protein SecB n=1 Tax=Thiohalorhabdus methylotrophus TaxID=3242694 RepID=A0ABV4TXZ0_9GAMM
MSEQQGAPEEQPVFALERVYIKDLSFESPNVPEMFAQQGQPQVNVELGTQGRMVSDQGHMESVLTVTVRSTHEDKTVFIAEVQQAGLFRVSGIPDEQLEQLMGINCPTILFPYAREAISSVVARGGFQQLLLDPVNFQALYEQSRQQQAGEGGEH